MKTQILRYFTLALLFNNLGVSASKQEKEEKEEVRPTDIQMGRCPYAPGSLTSTRSKDLDLSKVLGPWHTIYEEKDTNEYV